MDLISHISNNSVAQSVLSLADAKSFLQEDCGIALSPEQWNYILQPYLIPVFARDGQAFLLSEDLRELIPLLRYISTKRIVQADLFSGVPQDVLVAPCVRVDVGSDRSQLPPVFYAGCRNLMRIGCTASTTELLAQEVTQPYFGLSRVTTDRGIVLEAVDRQILRSRQLDSSRASQFANSAYYMGSKKVLAPFIVEAISESTDPDSTVVDLMCGSGAASGAFSQFWQTYASDAQTFCRALAVIQGAGYNSARAQAVLHQINDHARRNIDLLGPEIEQLLNCEDRIFHSDFGLETVDQYRHFCSMVPIYPDTQVAAGWNPTHEVQKRRNDARTLPYCLATAYFPNVYFGLRQCMEIDSIRYAIDQLEDELDKTWALGALITTMSTLGLTYAGHFAQPVLRSPADVTPSNVARILERRAASVLHEFSIRLLSLADESQRTRHPVRTVAGPWRNALQEVQTLVTGPVTVYVDAPYKRDEYSRYYHVLETVTNYMYPSSVGAARIPEKTSGERFKSEFFTRNRSSMVTAFVDVVKAALSNGWSCAWSYADTGAIAVVDAIDAVTKTYQSFTRRRVGRVKST
jgi:adenine-specific DNA-methyltransferase